MPAIAITPASDVRGTTFTVTGSGFTKGQRLKMTVDGSGSTTNRFRAERNGTFVVGVTTGTSSSLGTHTVRILVDSNSAVLATGTFQVVAAPPVEPPPVEPPPVEPPPVEPPPPTGKSVTVTSVVALLAALDDNTLDEIVVKNGTYVVSGASTKQANSLWIGAKYADRTKPILVRAETKGGVTFDGAGATYWIGLSFTEGAHDQTWDGFNFGNGTPLQTGVITFGGTYGVLGPQWAPPHHITLRNIKILGTIRSTYAGSGDHSIYISESASPGAHDILIENYTVDGAGGVNTALTMYHSQSGYPNASNVTLRNVTVTGTYQAIEIWDSTIKNLLIEGARISNVRSKAVRYEQGSGIVLRDIVSTGTPGGQGFYSSKGSAPPGTPPPGVTFENCSFG